MKEWIHAHPWMTLFIALAFLGTIRAIFLGFDFALMKKKPSCKKGQCNNPENNPPHKEGPDQTSGQ